MMVWWWFVMVQSKKMTWNKSQFLRSENSDHLESGPARSKLLLYLDNIPMLVPRPMDRYHNDSVINLHSSHNNLLNMLPHVPLWCAISIPQQHVCLLIWQCLCWTHLWAFNFSCAFFSSVGFFFALIISTWHHMRTFKHALKLLVKLSLPGFGNPNWT